LLKSTSTILRRLTRGRHVASSSPRMRAHSHLSFSWPLIRMLPRTIRRLAPPMAMPICTRYVGIVCVSDRAFLAAVMLTIIPYGPQELCLSISSGQLVLQRPLEDAQKRRGNARQLKAASTSASQGCLSTTKSPRFSPPRERRDTDWRNNSTQTQTLECRINHDLLRQHPSPNGCAICPWREPNGNAACGL
jgi:hypothetical protein